MNYDLLKVCNQEFNPRWLYTGWCFQCRQKFTGTEEELREIFKSRCSSPGGVHQVNGSINIYPLPGRSICLSCGKWYRLVRGGENTESQCDKCARDSIPVTQIKMGSQRELSCNGFFTLGTDTAHAREKFLIGGEDWACCITNNSSNWYMGESSQKCLRKGRVHVEDLEKHLGFPGGAQDEYCGILCETHANRLQKQWAVKLTKL